MRCYFPIVLEGFICWGFQEEIISWTALLGCVHCAHVAYMHSKEIDFFEVKGKELNGLVDSTTDSIKTAL